MQKAPDAFIVTVIKEPAKETTLADVIIGSFGVTGLLVLLALGLGVVVAVVRYQLNRRVGSGRLPPITPTMSEPPDEGSSQAR